MFNYCEDSEKLFHLLDEHLKSSIKLNNNQAFIIQRPSFFLILYIKVNNKEKLVGFEISDDQDFGPEAHLLLNHLQDLVASGKTEFEPALETLSEFLMGRHTSELFFDAH